MMPLFTGDSLLGALQLVFYVMSVVGMAVATLFSTRIGG